VYESLKSIKEKFHFHLIDAVGSPDDGTEVLLLPLCSILWVTVVIVRERLQKELEYQSSMELGDDTLEVVCAACNWFFVSVPAESFVQSSIIDARQVRRLPLASELIQNARFEMVRRLDRYKARHSSVLDKVVDCILSEFMPIIRRQVGCIK